MPLGQSPRGSGTPVALALLALSLPGTLVGFDRGRFAGRRRLDTHVRIAKQEVRAYFSRAHLAISRLHKGFARALSEQPR